MNTEETLYSIIMSLPLAAECKKRWDNYERQFTIIGERAIMLSETEEEEIGHLKQQMAILKQYLSYPPILDLLERIEKPIVLDEDFVESIFMNNEIREIISTYNADYVNNLFETLNREFYAKNIMMGDKIIGQEIFRKIEYMQPNKDFMNFLLGNEENINDSEIENEEVVSDTIRQELYDIKVGKDFNLFSIKNPFYDAQLFVVSLNYLKMSDENLQAEIQRILGFLMLKMLFVKEHFDTLKMALNLRLNKPSEILSWNGSKADFLRIIVPLCSLEKFKGLNNEKIGQAEICKRIARSWGISLVQPDSSIKEAFAAASDTVLKIINDITNIINLKTNKK